ncbi:hypothetical protein BD310DRAFT_460313 [Dichomitus squalens]|uniref:Uncharacterized protein n=1 Tax=Dichomitus squalens TaxID=114155 RepID=A0A4Q9QBF4_9APHY|nr:hypothetical protein BD310DRAFT_460313 [Dichomitus squalens]
MQSIHGFSQLAIFLTPSLGSRDAAGSRATSVAYSYRASSHPCPGMLKAHVSAMLQRAKESVAQLTTAKNAYQAGCPLSTDVRIVVHSNAARPKRIRTRSSTTGV